MFKFNCVNKMKSNKLSSSYLIKNNHKLYIKNPCKKYSNNILLNNYDSYINLKLHRNKTNSKIQNKKEIKTYNLNKTKAHSQLFNCKINNNSQKLLISKSNSELGHKNDFGIYTNTTSSSSNLKNNKKSLSKNFSSRNIHFWGKSFDLLKISNDDILSGSKDKYSNSKNKNKKSIFSLKNINKLKMYKIIKSKSFFNSCSRKKNNDSLIRYKNCKLKKNYKELYNILPKRNLLKNQKSNFCKYILDSTNLYLYQNNKEIIKTNCNSRNKNKKNKNIIITNNNIIKTNNNSKNKTNKNKTNKNKSMYIDFNIKNKGLKNSIKKINNLPFHPNYKMINKTEANQYYAKKIINLTENNIPIDKKLVKNKTQLSTKNLMQNRIKNDIVQKIINNSGIFEINCFSDKTDIKKKGKRIKNQSKLDKNRKKNDDKDDLFEGAEMGHFKLVKLIQEIKKNCL